MPFFYYDSTILFLVPAMILAFWAEIKVKRAYSKFSAVGNIRGITGAQAARKILDAQGLYQVPIERTRGVLSDHYDPKNRIMRLSPKVFEEPSIASVSIAAHEAGHAIQHQDLYFPIKVRNAVVPLVNFASHISWVLLILGIVLSGAQGTFLFDLGILFFLVVLIFHLITLPVELDASKRAVQALSSLGILYEEEISSAKKVLSAAAMTYVAALAVSVANFVRLLALRGRDS